MTGLTKKHFEAIAEILAKHEPEIKNSLVFMDLVKDFCYYLKSENPNFRETQFTEYIAEQVKQKREYTEQVIKELIPDEIKAERETLISCDEYGKRNGFDALTDKGKAFLEKPSQEVSMVFTKGQIGTPPRTRPAKPRQLIMEIVKETQETEWEKSQVPNAIMDRVERKTHIAFPSMSRANKINALVDCGEAKDRTEAKAMLEDMGE